MMTAPAQLGSRPVKCGLASSQLQAARCAACISRAGLVALLLACGPVHAHHSYEDYLREERYEFSGVITDVHWGNPHILLTVSSDNEDMRIEWITTAGADKTGAAREQFAVGASITVIGSRNRDPDQHVMTLIKEFAMPATAWRWISPALPSIR